MNEVANMLLRAMAIGIGLDDEEFFLCRHSGNNNQLRLLHYPPVLAADIENQKASRMPAHSDWGTFTMLFQDDCGGLQVNALALCFYLSLTTSRWRIRIIKETLCPRILSKTPS